jgi:fructokinase
VTSVDEQPAPGGKPILVAGEALVDLVPAPGGVLSAHPGGGPYNVARTAARLGAPVAFLGRLSTDRFGERLARELLDDGVDLDAIVRTDEPTTLALAEFDGDGSARYRFYGDGTSAAGLTPREALRVVPERFGALHIGTLGLVMEPMSTAIEALVRDAPESMLVMVDPNCRPSAIADPPGYRRRIARVIARADVVKVSIDDLEYLYPGKTPEQAARAVLAGGPQLVLITRHARGAVVVTSGQATAVPTPRVRVVDTVGAGDAFGGAFLAHWQGGGLGRAELDRTHELIEATRFACTVAAIVCERAGAVPPTHAELTARMDAN